MTIGYFFNLTFKCVIFKFYKEKTFINLLLYLSLSKMQIVNAMHTLIVSMAKL